MSCRYKRDEEFLEDLENVHRKMRADDFEEDCERRRGIFATAEQMNYWCSDSCLVNALSEQRDMLVAEEKENERLMNSMREETVQLREEVEKRGVKDNGEDC